jgi:hypothetical protein
MLKIYKLLYNSEKKKYYLLMIHTMYLIIINLHIDYIINLFFINRIIKINIENNLNFVLDYHIIINKFKKYLIHLINIFEYIFMIK